MTQHPDTDASGQPLAGRHANAARRDGSADPVAQGARAAAGAHGAEAAMPFSDLHGGVAELVPVHDGVRLHLLRWGPPPGAARAAFVYLHGIASHGAWFAATAAFLAERGLAVYAPDRRGSGRSDGPRGHLESVEQALADVDCVIDLVAEREPGRPILLAGSSWAAKLAIAYADARGDRLDGLLLLAPGLVPSVNLPLAQRLRVLAAHRRQPLTTLPIPLTPEMYTDSVVHQDQIRHDPLRLLDATARFYWETNRLDRQRDRLAAQLRVPTLLLIGERDAMADVPGTRRWFSRIGTPDRTIKVYAGAAHTLDFQEVAETYRADLIGWIDARLAAHAREATPPRPAAGAVGGSAATSPPADLAVARVEALLVELPFWFSFGHALAARASSQNLVVGVTLTDGTVGWGEGVPREYVTGETADGALARVVETYGPALIGSPLPTTDVPARLRALRDRLHDDEAPPGAAWCAVETALLDAIGRSTGRPAAALLGGAARTQVRYSGVVPFAKGPALAAVLGFFRAYGFAQVKLKVGQGAERDVAVVRLARRLLGPAVALRVDTNCAWTADETLAMAAELRPFGVHAYEQPVPADDVEGLARLVRELPEDVVLDESLRSVADARRLAEARAGTVFNVRVSKCGGPLAALEIVELARAAGLRCQLGAQVGESGILSAAGRLVATVARPGFVALEGSDNRFLLRRDLTREDLTVRRGGWGPATTGPGLGVTVPRELLEAATLRRAEVGDAWPRRTGTGGTTRAVEDGRGVEEAREP